MYISHNIIIYKYELQECLSIVVHYENTCTLIY